jgi:hypothetical protein
VAEPHADGGGAPVELPTIVWVRVSEGSRAPGDLEDRAARYDACYDVLTINADFRNYVGAVEERARRYPGIVGARAKLEMTVREWWETQLVEAVVGVKRLAGSPHWQEKDIRLRA